MSWLEMSIEELNHELEKIQLSDKELQTFKKGKEMIDDAMELNENESARAATALLIYLICKAKEKNDK